MCVFGLLIVLTDVHFISEHRGKGFLLFLCVISCMNKCN